MIADASGRAIGFALAPGQAHELPLAPLLLALLSLIPAWIVADRGYASHAFRDLICAACGLCAPGPAGPSWRRSSASSPSCAAASARLIGSYAEGVIGKAEFDRGSQDCASASPSWRPRPWRSRTPLSRPAPYSSSSASWRRSPPWSGGSWTGRIGTRGAISSAPWCGGSRSTTSTCGSYSASAPDRRAAPAHAGFLNIVQDVVSLWRYVTQGVVPEGAVLKA